MLTVAAFYRFAPLPEPAARRIPLQALADLAGVRGTILLAGEGINGTIAGTAEGISHVLDHLGGWDGFAGLEPKFSTAATMPFARLKVRVKREIVTMGAPLSGAAPVGTYVAPQDWNALIGAPDVAVIDTRNAFEVAMGRFSGAIDPETATFGAFPDWWRSNADRFRGKRIAMYCTGGIRCEKATAWLVAQGVPQVHHLQGGILRYLEQVPEAHSQWQGGCFVFDDRVALGHGLQTLPPSPARIDG
jgi:UPF0176 protein